MNIVSIIPSKHQHVSTVPKYSLTELPAWLETLVFIPEAIRLDK